MLLFWLILIDNLIELSAQIRFGVYVNWSRWVQLMWD